ncbi:MAG: sensor histidine kinase, partial [Flavobacteriales bacterium]|nr:sensor histidine kinase [Flavobacteriales bacterium]
RIQVLVKDSGVGMSAEQIERLASDGIQSERGTAGEVGTGLGLTLVKELVDLNEGELQIESRPGQGSVFKVALKRA